MNPLRELAPNEVLSRVRSEEVNGEHSLTIVTTRKLQEGWRALTVDGMGTWREWVVTEPDEEHQSGKHALGTYRFVWSLQYDLTYSYSHTHAEVGYGEMTKTAQGVAEKVLQDVPNWTVGTCDAANIADGKGAVFIYESAWSRLSKAVEVMGCEVESQIEVSNVGSVTARKLCLRAHVGSDVAHRRFDWGYDLTSVKRTPDPGPYYCRVVPLGRGEQEYAEDDETTFDWPLDITEETGTKQNPGPYYIQDDEAAAAFRIRLADGSYYYPTVAVNYDEDDPELLLKAAREDLHNHTRPGVTYEASVLQLAQAGMNVQGVALGDDVQVVDRGFNADAALRIQGRVMKIEVDELSPETTMQLTIGQLKDNITNTISGALTGLNYTVSRNSSTLWKMSTADYVKKLIDRLNTEINATGGYSYFVPGEGLVTYDVEVSDPLVGSEATKVVQIKGGSIRIADSKKSGFSGIDDWNWKSVFTSGKIATELLVATNIVTGILEDAAHKQNANTGNFWNLDTGELRMAAASAKVGNKTLATYIGDIADDATDALTQQEILKRLTGGYTTEGLYISNGHLYINGSAIKTGSLNANLITTGKLNANLITSGKIQSKNGSVYFDLDNNEIVCSKISHTLTYRNYGGTTGTGTITIDVAAIEKYEDGTATTDGGVYARVSNPAYTYGEIKIAPARSSSDIARIHTYNDFIINSSSSTWVNGHPAAAASVELDGNDGVLRLSARKDNNGYVSGHGLYIYALPQSGLNVSHNHFVKSDDLYVQGYLTAMYLEVFSTKNRVVETSDYGSRLQTCYETTVPMFGDVGSGRTDDSGICYVLIDDIFAETTRLDCAYQVFLQKCGDGNIWVAEKTQNYFLVCGTPNLSFDWELKARQVNCEYIRLEQSEHRHMQDEMKLADVNDSVYNDELNYVSIIESLYE